VAQPGAVWLAGATGHPLLPFHFEANRAWTIGSWDRTQIPKPFNTVAVAIGSPLHVTSIDDGAIEAGCATLTQQLAALERVARERAGAETGNGFIGRQP
jgi:lysophospholipid acyltransferase (LPLAT)-like uncharacterized protein